MFCSCPTGARYEFHKTNTAFTGPTNHCIRNHPHKYISRRTPRGTSDNIQNINDEFIVSAGIICSRHRNIYYENIAGYFGGKKDVTYPHF